MKKENLKEVLIWVFLAGSAIAMIITAFWPIDQ